MIQSAVAWADTIDWGKTVAAVIAGGTGTFGLIKGAQETWDRFSKRRLAVEHQLTDNDELGNTINIVNLSDKPLPISHVDVVWARWRPWGKKVTYEPTDMEWTNGFTLAAHDRRVFTYAEADHFAWGAASHKMHGRLFFRVWLAGKKRPEWFRIT